MVWRQRRTVLVYLIVNSVREENMDDEKEVLQMKARRTRIIIVKIKFMNKVNLLSVFVSRMSSKRLKPVSQFESLKVNFMEFSALLEESIKVLLGETVATQTW